METKTLSDGSTWLKVLHHNNPASYKFSSATAGNYNDGSNLMSLLWLLTTGNFLNTESGYYEFLVEQKATSSSSVVTYRWKQTNAPASTTSITGYTNVLNDPSGLCRCSGNTYLAHSNSTSNWWCACGCWTAFNGGIPGYGGATVTTGYLDLWVRTDGSSNKICTTSRLLAIALSSGAIFNDKSSPKNAAGSPNYCPLRDEITSDSGDYVPSAKISRTYTNNQLVCEKDIYAYSYSFTTNIAFNDAPASGGAASVKTSPTISFKTSDGVLISTTWPSVVYGTWTTTSVSGSNLGTTEKSRTSIGTGTCVFTAKAEYGGWSATSSSIVYQEANVKSTVWDNIRSTGTPVLNYASGSFTASGGSVTYYPSVTNSRYYHYKWTSGSEESTNAHYTDVSGLVEAYISNSNDFKLPNNGTYYVIPGGSVTVTHVNMGTNETTHSMTIYFRNYDYTLAYISASASVTNNKTKIAGNIASYGTPSVSIIRDLSSPFSASGGKGSVAATVKNSRYYHYHYDSGSDSSNYTEEVWGTVTLSISSLICRRGSTTTNISRFSLSGTTLTHSSMITSAGYDEVTVLATNAGDSTKTATATYGASGSTYRIPNQIEYIGYMYDFYWNRQNTSNNYTGIVADNTFGYYRHYIVGESDYAMGTSTYCTEATGGATAPYKHDLVITKLYYTSGVYITSENITVDHLNDIYVPEIFSTRHIGLYTVEFGNPSTSTQYWNYKVYSSTAATSEVTWCKMTQRIMSYLYVMVVCLEYNSGSQRSWYPAISYNANYGTITIQLNIPGASRADGNSATISCTIGGYKFLGVEYTTKNNSSITAYISGSPLKLTLK